MFVNNVPFVFSVYCNIRFGNSEGFYNQREVTNLMLIQKVYTISVKHGFNIITYIAYLELESMSDYMMENMKMTLKVESNGRHIPVIEWLLLTIKE